MLQASAKKGFLVDFYGCFKQTKKCFKDSWYLSDFPSEHPTNTPTNEAPLFQVAFFFKATHHNPEKLVAACWIQNSPRDPEIGERSQTLCDGFCERQRGPFCEDHVYGLWKDRFKTYCTWMLAITRAFLQTPFSLRMFQQRGTT